MMSHDELLCVRLGVSVWSAWIFWSGLARQQQPSKKTPGTATCVDPAAPTAYCGGGMTGPADYSISLPTTTSRNL